MIKSIGGCINQCATAEVIDSENAVRVVMTLTAPGCPVAGEMPGWVAEAIEPVPGVKQVKRGVYRPGARRVSLEPLKAGSSSAPGG